jgi:hypothetical protein
MKDVSGISNGPLERTRPLLPDIPPSDPSPLLVGQYWKLNHQLPVYNLHVNDVIRFDGQYDGKVIVTRYKRTITRNQVKHCEQQIHVPSQFLCSPQKASR